MAKIFSIAFALAAVLLVAYAYPKPQEEGGAEPPKPEVPEKPEAPGSEGGEGGEAGGEASEGGEGEEGATQSPCAQFEEQCKGQGGQVDNGAGGQQNQTQGQTPPPMSAQCQAMQAQCGQQNGMTPPGGMTAPGGMTQPAQPTQPGMTQPPMSTPAAELPSQNSTMPNFGGIGRR